MAGALAIVIVAYVRLRQQIVTTIAMPEYSDHVSTPLAHLLPRGCLQEADIGHLLQTLTLLHLQP